MRLRARSRTSVTSLDALQAARLSWLVKPLPQLGHHASVMPLSAPLPLPTAKVQPQAHRSQAAKWQTTKLLTLNPGAARASLVTSSFTMLH